MTRFPFSLWTAYSNFCLFSVTTLPEGQLSFSTSTTSWESINASKKNVVMNVGLISLSTFILGVEKIIFLLFLSYLSNAFRQLFCFVFFWNPDFLVVTRKRAGLLNATLPLLKTEILGIQFENLFYKHIVFSTLTSSIISRIKCFEIRFFFPLEALIIYFWYLHEYYMKNKIFSYKRLVSDLNIYLLKTYSITIKSKMAYWPKSLRTKYL